MAKSKTTFAEDLERGTAKENKMRPYVSKKLKCEMFKIGGSYSRLDFSNKDGSIMAELKSRRNYKNSYSTTMVGLNKVYVAKRLKKQGVKCYFFFLFYDGLYYYKYNKEMFKWNEWFVRNKRSDFVDLEKEYSFIPIEKLKKVKCYFKDH